MRMSIKIRQCLFLIFFLICSGNAYVQQPKHTNLQNYSWLDTKDQKAWEKQLAIIQEAEDLMKSSNDLYIEANGISSDMDLSEKKRASTQASLEEKALSESKNALLKFKEGYAGCKRILENYIDRFDGNVPALSEYERYQSQADLKYEAAGKIKTTEEQELLAEANENQLLAIEQLIDGLTVPESDYKQVSSSGGINIAAGDDDLVIDKEMYERYQLYINNEDIAAPIGLQQILQMEGEDISVEKFATMWDEYTHNEPVSISTAAAATVLSDSSAEQTEAVSGEQIAVATTGTQIMAASETRSETGSEAQRQLTSDQEEQVIKIEEQKMLEEIVREEIKAEQNEATFSTDKNYVTGTLSATEYLEFRVQIAASRIPLNMAQVQSIYKGPLSLVEVKDGSYFKYQIRGFQLLTDAQKVISESDVSSAYLAAYKNGQGVDLAEAAKEAQVVKKMVEERGRNYLKDIEFAIQIAASRVRMTESQLSSIYDGSQSVAIVFEEGWYKYQILSGNNLSKAYSILDEVDVEKAFLVAYRNAKKLKLYKALKEYKNYLP